MAMRYRMQMREPPQVRPIARERATLWSPLRVH